MTKLRKPSRNNLSKLTSSEATPEATIGVDGKVRRDLNSGVTFVTPETVSSNDGTEFPQLVLGKDGKKYATTYRQPFRVLDINTVVEKPLFVECPMIERHLKIGFLVKLTCHSASVVACGNDPLRAVDLLANEFFRLLHRALRCYWCFSPYLALLDDILIVTVTLVNVNKQVSRQAKNLTI